MAKIEIDDVVKKYGEVTAVNGIDLTVEDGEFVVLLGPSGCGKSTLLRMVAGLEDISGGEIRFDGQRVNALRPQKRNVAMVFQNYALYPHMTVRQNLAFGLRVRGEDDEAIEPKIGRAARTLGIDSFLDRKPRQLSGGQRQRVAMGRSIVRAPVAFLFDEPLSNLDAKLRGQMRIEIRQLQRELQTTALYVTHDQVEAMTLADRVVVMNGGRIEQVASPLELYERPATLFVADFVGTNPMNFIDAQVREEGRVVSGQTTWPITLPDHRANTVRLGIRPEDFRVESGAAQNVHVTFIEPLGSDTLVHGRADEQNVLLRIDPQTPVRIGDRLPVAVNAAKLHAFDPETGLRVN